MRPSRRYSVATGRRGWPTRSWSASTGSRAPVPARSPVLPTFTTALWPLSADTWKMVSSLHYPVRFIDHYPQNYYWLTDSIDRFSLFNEPVVEFKYENVLSGSQLQLVANASGCLNHRSEPDCSNMCFHTKYRTIDGTCNNLQKPLLGSSLTAFKRLLPPAYENGFNLPIGMKC